MSQKTNSSGSLRVVRPQILSESKHSTTQTTALGLAQYSARRLSQGFNLLSRRFDQPDIAEDLAFSEPEDEDGNAPAEGVAGSASNGSSIDGPDTILAAQWDTSLNRSHVLTLVFRDGVQLWDCHQLAALRELCYIPAPQGSDIVCARLLQEPLSDAHQPRPQSSAWKHAPLLAFTCISHRNNTPFTTLYIYSLDLDKTVKEVTVKGHIVQLLSNQHFIVLSCISPPAIHVLLSHSFSGASTSPITDLALHPQTGYPLVDLGSSRLLAYASTTGLSFSSGSGVLPSLSWEGRTSSADREPTQPAELARKFSQGALSGMRAIGDLGSAYWSSSRSPPPQPTIPGISKSAPSPSVAFAREGIPKSRDPSTVKVFDLKSHKIVAHFSPSTNGHTPVSLLSLSPTGSLLLVSTAHAHEFNIFQVRPAPGMVLQHFDATCNAPAVWHRYRLPRGVTPADARRADWSSDGKFVSVYTSHGTSHIFGIRPTGGVPSYPSHLQGGVRNSTALEPLAITIQHSAKLRATQGSILPARVAAPATACFDVSPMTLEDLRHDASSEVRDALTAGPNPATKSLLHFSPQDGTLALVNMFATVEHGFSVASGASSGLSSMLQRHASAPGSASPASPTISLQLDRKLVWPMIGSRLPKPDMTPTALSGAPAAVAIRFDDSRRWTAQAEVRTFNLSKNVLPRSIYLSHTFVFYIFSRKFSWTTGSLRPPSRRVPVRREVQFLSTDSTGGTSPSAEGVSEPIRMAMKAKLSIEARSASPGSPSYLAPMALNGVPGKSGQVWPVKAITPHLEYVQDGWRQMRSDLTRRSVRPQHDSSEPSTLSFEDEHSTHLLLEEGIVPGSEEDMPSLGQDSGSSSTRHTSEDAWSRWEHGSSDSPDQPSPSEPSALHHGDPHGRRQDIEPFVLDEDFAVKEQSEISALHVPGLEVDDKHIDTPPLISLGSSPATPSIPAPISVAPSAGVNKDDPTQPTQGGRKSGAAGRRKKR